MFAEIDTAPRSSPTQFRDLPERAATWKPQTQVSCSDCRLRELCLPRGLSDGPLEAFSAAVFAHRRLRSGQALFRAGEAFDSVYLVRSGFVKTLVLLEDGREQVTGLQMPGDMLGMDGLASGRHVSDAIAVDNTEICVVPYERLETLSQQAREVQRHLHRMFAKEIVREQRMMLLLGSMNAEERVSAFLLNLSERLTARGYSPSHFVLRLTREDIGSLLGMKLETVSRIFSKFQKAGLIEVDGKQVRIVSINGLSGILNR